MERCTFSAKKLNYKKEQNSFKTQFLKFEIYWLSSKASGDDKEESQ